MFKAGEVSLPIIEKITDRKLLLQNYTIDKGHLSGLIKAINCSETLPLEKVMFENCGIDDG